MTPAASERWADYEVITVDASAVCSAGAETTDARLHVQMRVTELDFVTVRVEDVSVGESGADVLARLNRSSSRHFCPPVCVMCSSSYQPSRSPCTAPTAKAPTAQTMTGQHHASSTHSGRRSPESFSSEPVRAGGGAAGARAAPRGRRREEYRLVGLYDGGEELTPRERSGRADPCKTGISSTARASAYGKPGHRRAVADSRP